MTVFIIIASILTVFAFLLLCPVTVYMVFEEDFSAKIKFLFLKFSFPYTRNANKKKRQKETAGDTAKEEKKKDKFSSIRELIKEKGVGGFFDMIKEFASLAEGAAKKIFRHIVIDRFSVYLCIVGEDAADTAIQFGYAGAVVYPAAGAIIANTKCRDHDIKIIPGFEAEESIVRFHSKIHVRLLYIVFAVLSAAYKYIKPIVIQKIKSK